MMYKIIFVFMFSLLPSLLFSQGIYKTNMGLTLGTNFPLASQEFTSDYKAGYNFGFHIEHTVGKITVAGGEFNFSRFAPKGDNANGVKYGVVLAYMKIQDNTARNKDIQFFLKGGAGMGYAGVENLKPQHGGYLPFTFALAGGAGINYFVSDKNKFFAEADYRYFPNKERPRNALYFNIGFSFYLR